MESFRAQIALASKVVLISGSVAGELGSPAEFPLLSILNLFHIELDFCEKKISYHSYQLNIHLNFDKVK
jgi:hypothetical protein